MKGLLLVLMMTFAGVAATYAQGKAESKKIQAAITQWAQAADLQNAEAAGAFLDDNYLIVMNRLFGSAEVATMDKTTYLQMLREKKFGGDPRILKFKRITVTGSIASVQLEMTGSKLQFRSFIQLIQDPQGNWKLVSDVPYIMPI
jgi:ketosteroid isomerase-like protein